MAKPKWEKMEHNLIDKDITPATITWPERSKNWYYAHGGSLNLETSECIYGQNIQQVAQRLQDAIQAVAQGTFQPDREKDELSYGPSKSRTSSEYKGQRSGSVEVWF